MILLKTLATAVREVFGHRWAKVTGAASFVVALAVYLLMLPATFTGGRPGWRALAYLTPALVIWSIVFASLLALLVPMTLTLLARGHGERKAGAAAAGGLAGLVLSLVTPLLCCTPVLPILFAFLAGWLPFLAGGAGGAFQGFLATHEGLFFAVSLALLLSAVFWDAREIARGACCVT